MHTIKTKFVGTPRGVKIDLKNRVYVCDVMGNKESKRISLGL